MERVENRSLLKYLRVVSSGDFESSCLYSVWKLADEGKLKINKDYVRRTGAYFYLYFIVLK